MKIAIIGSLRVSVENLQDYIPNTVTEIVSGGAKGVDSSAKEYAFKHKIKLTEFYPEYSKFGKAAPLHRNITIINYADLVWAFGDGKSLGTKFVIDKYK